jgi:hypothetical protein
MLRKIPILILFILPNLVLGQFSKSAKRAYLKTRNKQISRFTVRTDFSKSKKYVSFGGGAGISNYFGDLTPRSTRTSSDLGYSRSYFTVFYLMRVHPNVNIRTSLSWMRLRGDDFSVSGISNPTPSDIGRFKRNLSFRNDIFEVSSVGLFEIFPTDRGYLRRSFINPYGIMGLSVFHHNPETKTPILPNQKSDWVNLRPLGTEGQFTGIPGTPRPYSLIQIGIPIGAGVRYRLFDKFDLSLEFCYRFIFTDYIDDVSGRYPSDETYQQMLNQKNYLGITLSNRTTEIYSPIENERRDIFLRSQKDLSLLNNKETYLVEGDKSWTRLTGTNFGASPRGSKRRDYWIVTGVHLSYILEIKQKPPKFR